METIIGLLPIGWKLVTTAGVPPSEIGLVVALVNGIMRLVLDVAAVLVFLLAVVISAVGGKLMGAALWPTEVGLEVGIRIERVEKRDEAIDRALDVRSC